MMLRSNRNYTNEMQECPKTRQCHLLLELIREANSSLGTVPENSLKPKVEALIK
jgi:hypothetical protein